MSAKHQIIYDEIVDGIRQGRYPAGERMPTECELAARFEVSRQTVLKALNTLKSKGVLIGRQGKGTFVAEPVASRRVSTRQVAFVCSNLQDGYGHKMLVGIESVLARADYSLLTCNTAGDILKEMRFLKNLHTRGIDGVILLPYQPDADTELVKQLTGDTENPLPVVCVDRDYPGLNLPSVTTDNYEASFEGVSYLISQGHRRIGFIVNTTDSLETVSTVVRRYRGYRAALAANGIEFRPEFIQEVGPEMVNGNLNGIGSGLFGYMPMHRLLGLPEPPTAVFLLWDGLVTGALSAIGNSWKKCPDDISLLGFNDDELCSLITPRITSIRQPGEEVGRQAAELLLRLLAGEDVAERQIVLKTRLIIRESVKNINPAGKE